MKIAANKNIRDIKGTIKYLGNGMNRVEIFNDGIYELNNQQLSAWIKENDYRVIN